MFRKQVLKNQAGVFFFLLAQSAWGFPVPRAALYGMHFPQGMGAVDYAYSPEGMWKNSSSLEYLWNYYGQFASPGHPANRSALIEYANGLHETTAPDANGHLLGRGGFSFHEHNGKGVGGQTKGNPFTQFWFDDNWLARYMSQAYDKAEPSGLSAPSDFNRWQILGGDVSHWAPYHQDAFDQLALDGLYYYFREKSLLARAHWQRMIDKSGLRWDEGMQRYFYPNVTENYYLGLMKILTDLLLDSGGFSSSFEEELLQHSVSLRSVILSNQERAGDRYLGWTSSSVDTGSLMNTESLAVNTLALGVDAAWVFEAGQEPLRKSSEGGYFLRPHHVLSAITEGPTPSKPGYLSYGPGMSVPLGGYHAEFFMRSPAPRENIALVEVYDSVRGQVLAKNTVVASDLKPGNHWTRISLPFQVAHTGNALEFRTYWYGASNVDLALIRVRKDR